ncbi:hypothetical protein N0V85_008940 [Neurospora sp. IMI 360204]|nr:hypothetical protein N0V85_008940 [Neurospora sp. IMI 360204]
MGISWPTEIIEPHKGITDAMTMENAMQISPVNKVVADTSHAATSDNKHSTGNKASACLKPDTDVAVADKARNGSTTGSSHKMHSVKSTIITKKSVLSSADSSNTLVTGPDTPVTASPKPSLRDPEDIQIKGSILTSPQTASTQYNHLDRPEDYEPRAVSVLEGSANGVKYAMLNDNCWYKLEDDSYVRQLNDQQYAEAVDLSIAAIDSFEVYTKEDIEEALAKMKQMTNKTAKVVPTRSEEEKEALKKGIDSKKGNDGKKGNGVKKSILYGKSHRRKKRPKDMTWGDLSFVDKNGLLNTKANCNQMEYEHMGYRHGQRCTWILVPECESVEEFSGNSSFPALVLTSPEGGNFSLHDPACHCGAHWSYWW